MHTLSCATVAFVASFAAAKAEAPTDRSLPFADIADPAARAAFEAMAREIGGLKTSVKALDHPLAYLYISTTDSFVSEVSISDLNF